MSVIIIEPEPRHENVPGPGFHAEIVNGCAKFVELCQTAQSLGVPF